MNFPDNLKYVEEHQWVRVEGNVGTIGLTDHAQSELGDIVYIDIPDESAELSSGDSFGTIEAVKTVADLFSPLSGKIIEVNTGLNDNPEVVNTDPYADGWIVKIEFTDAGELDKLIGVDAYKELIGQ